MGAVYDIYIAMSHTHILTCVVGRYITNLQLVYLCTCFHYYLYRTVFGVGVVYL